MSCSTSRSVISSKRVGTGCPVAAAQARAEDTLRQRPPRSSHALELRQCGHVHQAQSSLHGVRRERGLLQWLGWCCGAGRLLRRLNVFRYKCQLGVLRRVLFCAAKGTTRADERAEFRSALAVESGGDRALEVLDRDGGVEIEGALDELDELEERRLVRARPCVVWVVQLAHLLKRRGHDRGHGIDAILGGGEIHQILQGVHESGCIARQRDHLSVSRSHACLLLVSGLLRRGRLLLLLGRRRTQCVLLASTSQVKSSQVKFRLVVYCLIDLTWTSHFASWSKRLLSLVLPRGSATLSVEAPILYEKGGAGLHEVH
jgi:hypothetical protein